MVGALPLADPTSRRRLLPAAGIGILLGAIDGGVIAPILPAVSQALNTTHGLSWLASGYFLGTALGAPASGGVGDARGHTFIISMGLAILFVGTLGCGAAGFLPDRVDAVVPVIFQFAFCRFLQGVGSAAIFTGAFALLPEMATPRQRARSTGTFSLIFAVPTMLGPLLGGLINDGMRLNVFNITISGWRMVFFLQLPVVLLALALMTRERSAPRGAGGSFDAAGLALVALAAMSCMTAIESLRALQEAQAGLAAALAAGSLVALHHVERRTRHPLLPPSLLELQAIRRPCISAALVGGALTAFALSIPANPTEERPGFGRDKRAVDGGALARHRRWDLYEWSVRGPHRPSPRRGARRQRHSAVGPRGVQLLVQPRGALAGGAPFSRRLRYRPPPAYPDCANAAWRAGRPPGRRRRNAAVLPSPGFVGRSGRRRRGACRIPPSRTGWRPGFSLAPPALGGDLRRLPGGERLRRLANAP